MDNLFQLLPAELIAKIFEDFSYTYIINIEKSLGSKFLNDETFKYLYLTRYRSKDINLPRYMTWELLFITKEYKEWSTKNLSISEAIKSIPQIIDGCSKLFETAPYLYHKLTSFHNTLEGVSLSADIHSIREDNIEYFEYYRLTNNMLKCHYDNSDFLDLNGYNQDLRAKDNKILYYYFQTGKTRNYTIKTLFTLNPIIYKLIMDEPRFTISQEVVLDFLKYLYVGKNKYLYDILKRYSYDYIRKLLELRKRSDYFIPSPNTFQSSWYSPKDNCEFTETNKYGGDDGDYGYISDTSDFYIFCNDYMSCSHLSVAYDPYSSSRPL